MKAWHQYLSDLANSVAVLSRAQLLQQYFRNRPREMLRTLGIHEAAGLITVSTEFVRQRTPVKEPIAIINPGEQQPSAEHIAYVGRQRWTDKVTPTLIVRGTAKLAALYGGQARTVVAANVSHEVALADLFLAKRNAEPEFEWTLVQVKPGGGALPDAITATGCIELIGMYNGAAVSAKLALAGSIKLELW